MLNHFPVSLETQYWSLFPEAELGCRGKKMLFGVHSISTVANKQQQQQIRLWNTDVASNLSGWLLAMWQVTIPFFLSGLLYNSPGTIWTTAGTEEMKGWGNLIIKDPRKLFFFWRNYRSVYNHLAFGRFHYSSCTHTFVWLQEEVSLPIPNS